MTVFSRYSTITHTPLPFKTTLNGGANAEKRKLKYM